MKTNPNDEMPCPQVSQIQIRYFFNSKLQL